MHGDRHLEPRKLNWHRIEFQETGDQMPSMHSLYARLPSSVLLTGDEPCTLPTTHAHNIGNPERSVLKLAYRRTPTNRVTHIYDDCVTIIFLTDSEPKSRTGRVNTTRIQRLTIGGHGEN